VLPADGQAPIQEAPPPVTQTPKSRERRPAAKKAAPRPPTVNAPPAPVAGAPHVAPLPPPIDVKPAPGAAAKPKPRPPLALTPQVANPPPRSN
jgi:large subunit ribosomal protein L24